MAVISKFPTMADLKKKKFLHHVNILTQTRFRDKILKGLDEHLPEFIKTVNVQPDGHGNDRITLTMAAKLMGVYLDLFGGYNIVCGGYYTNKHVVVHPHNGEVELAMEKQVDRRARPSKAAKHAM